MTKKEELVSYFYFLIGSISTSNFCKGRPSLLIAEIQELDNEFSSSDLDKLLVKFENEKSEAISKIREKFIN